VRWADAVAFILYGQEGSLTAPPAEKGTHHFVLSKDEAVIQHRQGWFTCLSAFHCPVVESRWIQDRQNSVSLFRKMRHQ